MVAVAWVLPRSWDWVFGRNLLTMGFNNKNFSSGELNQQIVNGIGSVLVSLQKFRLARQHWRRKNLVYYSNCEKNSIGAAISIAFSQQRRLGRPTATSSTRCTRRFTPLPLLLPISTAWYTNNFFLRTCRRLVKIVKMAIRRRRLLYLRHCHRHLRPTTASRQERLAGGACQDRDQDWWLGTCIMGARLANLKAVVSNRLSFVTRSCRVFTKIGVHLTKIQTLAKKFRKFTRLHFTREPFYTMSQ